MITISELQNDCCLDPFMHYLTAHLSENGRNGIALFQPLSQEQSNVDDELKAKFKDGLNKAVGERGWRKLWIAQNEENQVLGHIDIRSYNELNTEHRVLLGMGVDSKFRNLKIGQKLLESVIEYCRSRPEITWMDLQVLGNNHPAIGLYKKMKFRELSTMVDMFRIDKIAYDFISMTLNVEQAIFPCGEYCTINSPEIIGDNKTRVKKGPPQMGQITRIKGEEFDFLLHIPI